MMMIIVKYIFIYILLLKSTHNSFPVMFLVSDNTGDCIENNDLARFFTC